MLCWRGDLKESPYLSSVGIMVKFFFSLTVNGRFPQAEEERTGPKLMSLGGGISIIVKLIYLTVVLLNLSNINHKYITFNNTHNVAFMY